MYFLMPHCLEQEELIETLWNVNVERADRENSIQIELIETLWNVNLTIVPSFGNSSGN